ncbi:MAG: hypothetical protein FWF66_03040 [Candidatus Bathyarchaeota archaeon]|nr:hypothetical protein [Candidatus Termiticorpusculum sp.]MCL1970418.1 hypothetical protein [Candidatus Termiticorpusculum sp.]
MPIPQALVTRYFQLIVNRQYAEAERELERVKQKLQKTEWNRGYFRALYGMYLSRKNTTDSYAFFSKLDLSDKVSLHVYRREFLDNMRSGLHGDFDRGYFSAWGDCMRILTRMDIPAPTNPDNSKTGVTTDDGENAAEDTIETVRSDKSQVTIANFFNGDKKISVKTKKQVTVSESAVKTEEVAKKG